MKKLLILSLDIYEYELSKLTNLLIQDKLDFEIIVFGNKFDYLKEVEKISKEIVKRKDKYLISIDETGSAAGIVAMKQKGMVMAQINDEHSAKMTKDHNGAFGLALGFEIASVTKIARMIKVFAETKFSAGRHMIRIDMLGKMG